MAGALVFARVRGHAWWPARVTSIPARDRWGALPSPESVKKCLKPMSLKNMV